MKRMEVIESAMAQAQELSRIQNTFGAWEVLERVYRRYPEDQELNRLRGDFAVKAAQFASVIASAEQARVKGDYGKALFAYLEAKLRSNCHFSWINSASVRLDFGQFLSASTSSM